MSYWWTIKKIVYFGKGSYRGPNSEWIVSNAFGSMSTDFLCQCSFKKKLRSPTLIWGGHGCVDMVVGFSTTCAISASPLKL